MNKIAYLGIPGSYSFIAGSKFFKGSNNMMSNSSISDIFEKVINNKCDFGIVPLENSSTGSITESYDFLAQNDLSIIGEIILHVHHCFLVPNYVERIQDIKLCLSHQQAINQCTDFFRKYKWIKPEICSDSAVR